MNKEVGLRCECPDDVRDVRVNVSQYSLQELKALNHAANACPGDHDLARYKRADGTVATLCSCCYLSSDVRLP